MDITSRIMIISASLVKVNPFVTSLILPNSQSVYDFYLLEAKEMLLV